MEHGNLRRYYTGEPRGCAVRTAAESRHTQGQTDSVYIVHHTRRMLAGRGHYGAGWSFRFCFVKCLGRSHSREQVRLLHCDDGSQDMVYTPINPWRPPFDGESRWTRMEQLRRWIPDLRGLRERGGF